MAKQEMRDKADDHESVQGQESNSSRGPTISLILAVWSLGILGLFFSLFGVSTNFQPKIIVEMSGLVLLISPLVTSCYQ